MPIELLTLIIGLAAAAIGAIPGYIALRHQSRAQDADAVESTTNAYKTILERVGMLEKRVDELETEKTLLKDWAERLCKQITELGRVPVPMIVPARGQRNSLL